MKNAQEHQGNPIPTKGSNYKGNIWRKKSVGKRKRSIKKDDWAN
jgi:hypothetical protein